MKRIIYTCFGSLLIIAITALSNPAIAQDVLQLRITTPEGVIDWDIDATKTTNDHGVQIPESVSGEIVKAFDGITEPTDNDVWSDFGWYCCDSIVNPDEVAGKIAMISRGACSFSAKIWNAEKAGAIAVIIANRAPMGIMAGTHNPGLINMAGTAPESDSITIPAIFISYEDRSEIAELLEQGTVMATIGAETLYDAYGPQAYSTPLDQVKSFNPGLIAYTRTSDTLTAVDFQVVITDPSGGSTTFTEPIDTLLPGKDWPTGTVHEPIIQFADAYTPAEVGTYTMTFTATTQEGTWPIDDAEVVENFEVTEYTFALDDGTPGDVTGHTTIDSVLLNNEGIFDLGAMYRTGENGASLTHVSFAIANPGALEVGSGFVVEVYNADGDANGIPDLELPTEALASTIYSVDGTEVPNELIHAEFTAPVALDPNSIYLALVIPVAQAGYIPAYSTAGGSKYLNGASVIRIGDLYRPTGLEFWNAFNGNTQGDPSLDYPFGGRQPMIRMQLEGFTPPVSVELLPEGLVEIFPTLTKDMVNIQFDLAENTSEVQMIVVSTEGRTMHLQEYNNVMNETIQLNVQNYPAGNYFVTIKTDKGVRTKQFVVAR